MPRRLPVIIVLFCVLAAAVGCGGGGSSSSSDDDLGDLEAPIDTGTAPCFRRLDLTVFVNPAIPTSQFDTIEASLRDVPGVIAVTLVDQQSAYDEIVRLFPDTPGLGTLNPSDLPASFRVTVDDPSHAQDVGLAAQSIDGVGQVVLAQDTPQPVSPTMPC
jgi:hypothetical protein